VTMLRQEGFVIYLFPFEPLAHLSLRLRLPNSRKSKILEMKTPDEVQLAIYTTKG
jgi:hypothetical protein